MKRIAFLAALVLLLAACSPKAVAPPANHPAPPEPPPAVETLPSSPVPPSPPPRVYGPVPEVLARPVSDGGPQRVTFAAGDTVSKVGAYFLNVESGQGEAWVYPGEEGHWWASDISPDNRFVQAYGEKASYLIDRSAGAVWQWDVETVRPLLVTERGALFAEVARTDRNLHDTGRLFWSGLDFKPTRTFILQEQESASQALLSPDGQRIALLLRGEKPSVVLLDLNSESRQVLGVPGSDQWLGSTGLTAKGDNFEVSASVSEGNRTTDMPKWNERILRYNWQGEVLGDLHIIGAFSFISPDDKWAAWEEQDRVGFLAPVTVVADAATMKPHLTVLGASTCFAAVGSGGARWLADSSGLVLSTSSSQYRLLMLDGTLTEPPAFAGLTWKSEPEPAPDKVDRFAIGRAEVLDGSRRVGVKLEGFVTPQGLSAWGRDSRELRFALPPKPGGGACYEWPDMPQLVLRAGEPESEFPLVVESSECLPLRSTTTCLPRGTRLKSILGPDGRPGLGWLDERWQIYVESESGQQGWVDLTGNPLGWTK